MGDMTREPSMEEILSSIRRVIARDEAQRDGPVRLARGNDLSNGAGDGPGNDAGDTIADGGADDAADDNLSALERAADAMDRDRDDGAALSSLNDADDADDVLELTAASVDDAHIAEAAMIITAPTPATHEPLVSPNSLAASARALDTLSAALDGDTATPPPSVALASGPTTIDAMVEASLRPMLKQWLDTNLPAIVERLVAREIARITGGRI